MITLCVDPGIRHMSFCIMKCEDKKDFGSYEIKLWDVYNVLESDDYKCNGLFKNGKVCGRKCNLKYTSENDVIHSCKSHFPKDITMNKTHNFKIKAVSDYLLQDIVTVFIKKLDVIYKSNEELFNQVDVIQIELQPSFNPRMKMISHILYGKLIELYKGNSTTIKFIRASTKLRVYTGPPVICNLKGKYAQRKYLSVEYTKWVLKNQLSISQSDKWLPILESHLKQNDLSDTFCYAINALHGFAKTIDKKNKCIK